MVAIGVELDQAARRILAAKGKDPDACTGAEYLEACEEAQKPGAEDLRLVVKTIAGRAKELAGARDSDGVLMYGTAEEAAQAAVDEYRRDRSNAGVVTYDPEANRPVTQSRIDAVKSQLVHAKALEIANRRGVLVDDLDADRLRALYEEADAALGGVLYGKAAV